MISGQYDLVVAGGVESMSRVPMGTSTGGTWAYGEGFRERYDGVAPNQGIGAEMIAERWGLSRTQLDDFSLASHEKAAAATDDGRFAAQITPVTVPGGTVVDTDEGIRRGGTLAALARLRPAFKPNGVIHAGNSSQISDGAAALLLTSSDKARELGLTPIARIHTAVLAANDPVIMLTAPIPATRKALDKSGLRIGEIGAFEVNEAFAPVPLAWLAETGADAKTLNVNGGAIALGHPLGGSGARLMTTLVHHMKDNGIRYGCRPCVRAAAWPTPPSSSCSDQRERKAMRILVTGGQGKVGSAAAQRLSQAGHRVTVTDIRPAGYGPQHPGTLPYLRADLTDYGAAVGVVHQARPDAVVHTAGIPDPAHDPAATVFATNTVSTFNVAEAVATLGVGRLVNLSSETAPGYVTAIRPVRADYLPVDEDHALRPQDTYALSKAMTEQICDALVHRSEVSAVSVRPSLVLAPGDYPFTIPALQSRRGAPGFNYWSYVDTADLAELLRLAVEGDTPGHEVVYAAQPDNYFGAPLAELLEEAYGAAATAAAPARRVRP